MIGSIGWAPFVAELPQEFQRTSEPLTVKITAYGNRQNAFGPVHCSLRNLRWYGPSAWRSTDTEWTYQYRLEPTGVLSAPALITG